MEASKNKKTTPKPGKENTVITFQASTQPNLNIVPNSPTIEVIHHELPMPSTHVSPTFECNTIENTAGENPMCQTVNGCPILGHSRPPNACYGSKIGDLGGADPEPPELIITLLIQNNVNRLYRFLIDAFLSSLPLCTNFNGR